MRVTRSIQTPTWYVHPAILPGNQCSQELVLQASSTIEESKAFKVKKAFDEWHSCMVTKFEVEHKDIMKVSASSN